MIETLAKRWSQIVFILFVALFFLVSVAVVAWFFFGSVLKPYFAETKVSQSALIVELAQPVSSVNPLNFEFRNRIVAGNMFDGLVRIDADLGIRQGLAITFGSADARTWEFKLRKGVRFHDGSTLTPDDVLKSFEKATQANDSQLKSILVNVESVTWNGEKIVIKTKAPDPNFLRKVAMVFIYKESQGDFLGTGAYKVVSLDREKVTLTRNESYWGSRPIITDAVFEYIKDKETRVAMLKNNTNVLVRDLPSSMIADVERSGAMVMSQPGLEVTFMGYGKKVLSDDDGRIALEGCIKTDEIVKRYGPSVRSARGFVSQGVSGFVKKIVTPHSSEKGEFSFDLYYDAGLDTLAKMIISQCKEKGVSIFAHPTSGERFVSALRQGALDLYLLGWKSEFGDASDFYRSVVHSKKDGKGEFNAGGYANSEVDALIDEADNTFNEGERIDLLKRVMSIISNEIPFGLPLIEPQVLYGVKKGIDFVPRIDGYLMLSEIGFS